MKIIVRCPECRQTMAYKPRVDSIRELSDKRKTCVYCGRSFAVHPNPDDSRIVRQDT